MTDERIAELRGLLEHATPGPWFREEMDTRKRQYQVRATIGQSTGGCGYLLFKGVELDSDAALIVALVNAAPDLLRSAERERELEARVQALEEGLRPFAIDTAFSEHLGETHQRTRFAVAHFRRARALLASTGETA